MRRALVIGGGVAGPAVAQLLTESGWDAPVFEARPEPDSFEGLFLNVAANGRSVLAILGVEDRLLSDAHAAGEMVMWSGRGKRLGLVPNGPAGRPMNGGVIVRRGWLHEVIRTGAEDAGVKFNDGRLLVSVEDTGDGVTAQFADGGTEDADIIIGADGVGSQVRKHVVPGVEPTFTGLLGTGGFAKVPGLAPTPGRQHFVFGSRSFFGYLVREDGTTYWFANLSADKPPSAGERAASSAAWLELLRDLHSDDPAPVPAILEHTHGEVGGYPIFSLPALRTWSRGRCVLIGDAVHATSPSAGQGASLALEDAVVLANCLRSLGHHGSAFTAYEEDRRERVEAITAYAKTIDAQKRVTSSRVGMAVRDALLPFFLRKAANDKRHDWIHDYTVPWDR